MTSATLGGGGGQQNSDILLTHADGGGGAKVADTKLYFGWEKKEVNGPNH